MRHKILMLSTLTAALLLVVCLFAGCALLIPSLESIIAMAPDAQAAAIITASGLAMSDQTLSYRAETETKATMIVGSLFTNLTVETCEVSVAPNAETGEGFCGYVRSKTEATFPYNTNISKTRHTTTVGYQDGRLYNSELPSGTGQAKTMWSYATEEEYRAYRLGDTEESASTLNMFAYEMRSCVYSEETRCFTLTLSGPNQAALDAWERSLGSSNLNIENVTVTYTIGENYLPLETKTEITRGSGWEPITSTTVYTYENVTYDEKVALKDYNESPNLLLIKKFQKEAKNACKAEEGEYTYLVTATANGDKNNTTKETDRVRFGKDGNGKFTFTISVDEKYTVSYANGRLNSNAPNGIPKYITDEEARAMIEAQLNVAGFANASFSTFKLLDEEEGTYVLTAMSADTSAFAELVTQAGGTVRNITAVFYVTYRDGVLYSYRCELTVAMGSAYSPTPLNISATVILKEN